MNRHKFQPRPVRLSHTDLPIGSGQGSIPLAVDALLSKIRVRVLLHPADNTVNDPYATLLVDKDGNPRLPYFVHWVFVRGTTQFGAQGFFVPTGVTVTWDELNFYITTPLGQGGYELAIMYA